MKWYNIVLFFIIIAILILVGVLKTTSEKKNEMKQKELETAREKEREESKELLRIEYEKAKKDIIDKGLPVLDNETLKLTRGEVLHFQCEASYCKHKKEVIGYQAGSRGYSIRIMKGLSYRIGNSRGHNIKADVIEKTPGKIYLTNKKIVFTALTNSCTLKYDQIVNLDAEDGLLMIQTDKKMYQFDLSEKLMFMVILEHLLELCNNGEMAL